MHPALFIVVTFTLGVSLGWVGYLIAINLWYRRQRTKMLHEASRKLCTMGFHAYPVKIASTCPVCGSRFV